MNEFFRDNWKTIASIVVWVVLSLMFILGKSDTPPPAPPVITVTALPSPGHSVTTTTVQTVENK